MNTRILFERDPGVELEWNCPKETMKVRVRDPEESRVNPDYKARLRHVIFL